MKLAGKVALITGGGTGIGFAVAEKFVSEGAKVCITGRRQDVLEKAAQRFPSESVAICPGDVSRDEDRQRMMERTLALGGRLDILVNNAAFNVQGTITELSLSDWQSHLDVNLTGPFMLMKASIPHMIKAGGGSIINISSLGGLRCIPAKPAYCTTKAALIMLTQQAALDYGPQNIRCNVVCPGGVETVMTGRTITSLAKTLDIDEKSAVELLSSDVPLRRMAVPSELSGICLYLASDDASFTTAGVFVIDGGANVVDVGRVAVSRALKKKALH
jgi:meso-butanediol dehydrogenase / (S,S)-butanediol dehydrogenase / diacetyl reductase